MGWRIGYGVKIGPVRVGVSKGVGRKDNRPYEVRRKENQIIAIVLLIALAIGMVIVNWSKTPKTEAAVSYTAAEWKKIVKNSASLKGVSKPTVDVQKLFLQNRYDITVKGSNTNGLADCQKAAKYIGQCLASSDAAWQLRKVSVTIQNGKTDQACFWYSDDLANDEEAKARTPKTIHLGD